MEDLIELLCFLFELGPCVRRIRSAPRAKPSPESAGKLSLTNEDVWVVMRNGRSELH